MSTILPCFFYLVVLALLGYALGSHLLPGGHLRKIRGKDWRAQPHQLVMSRSGHEMKTGRFGLTSHLQV